MSSERKSFEQQEQQQKKSVSINDLPESATPAEDAESVKGGLIASGGGGLTWTDPDDGDELGGGE